MGKGKNKAKEKSANTSKISLVFGKITQFLKSRACAYILTGIHVALTLGLLSLVLYINMLPVKYFVPICFVLLVLCAVAFLFAHT